MNASREPLATAQRSSAEAPSERYWAHPRSMSGYPENATTDRSIDVHPDGDIGRPSSLAPPPRTASHRFPVAWLTTTAAAGPSESRAQRLVAHHGSPREAFVDPSTGSRIT